MATTVVPFAVEPTAIEGLALLTTKAVTDERGTVREAFRTSAFAEAGIACGPWLQVNLTETRPGAIRGMHAEQMTKLVGVAAGAAFGAWVDLRPGPGFGTVVTRALQVGEQLLVPPGVGNGFQALGEAPCQYVYAFDAEWAPSMAGVAVTPLDPALGIAWPVPFDPDDPAHVSAKDAGAPTLAEVAASRG